MASEIEHRPREPETGPTTSYKVSNNATATATAPLNGKPAPPQARITASFVPLFPDTTATASDASASASESGAGADDSDSATTTSRAISPVTSPPYWQLNTTDSGSRRPGAAPGGGGIGGHNRTPSAESVLPPGAITLQDNEEASSEAGVRNSACWARSVEVVSHVVVNGSATNIGAFVVWNIRVETLSGSFMNIRKRYSEFDDFRRQLIQTFPGFEAAVPALPPKSVISKFRPRFLEKRRAGLQYFLHCIMLNPEFSGAPVLKEFLFS